MTGLESLVKLVMQGLILSMIPTHCPPVRGIGQAMRLVLSLAPLPLACPGTGALLSGLTHRSEQLPAGGYIRGLVGWLDTALEASLNLRIKKCNLVCYLLQILKSPR